MLWAQTDLDAYDRLETLVSARDVGKPGANFMDTKSISEGDILLATFDSDTYLYRAQVSQQLHHSYFCFAILEYGQVGVGPVRYMSISVQTISVHKII